MRPNLIDDLGINYVNDGNVGLVGALLFHNNLPHQITRIRGDGIETVRYSGNMAKPSMEEVILPTNLLDKGFESLAHPDLGYRTAANGKLLLEFRQQQSFRRGLQLGEIKIRYPPVTQYIADRFDIDLRYYNRGEVKALATIEPCFMSLAEGLQRVKDRDIFVFAISPKLAVMPCSRPKEYLEIVYDGRAVGNISPEGKITGKITKVNTIMEKLNGQ